MLTRSSLALVALAAAAIVACDIKRGAEVDRSQAQPEREQAAEAAPAASEGRQAPPPRQRRSLEGDSAPAASVPLESLERVDLAGVLSSGELVIEVSDPSAQPGAPSLVDGDTESLVRTDGINPLVVTLTFTQPIRLRAARAYLAASAYDWVIEAQPGEGRLVASNVPERQWSQIVLPAPIETSVVRVELLRLERDDYVHANEIELYAEPSS